MKRGVILGVAHRDGLLDAQGLNDLADRVQVADDQGPLAGGPPERPDSRTDEPFVESRSGAASICP
jgi:hypothetical protein